VWR
jgi:DNA-binding transcriptional ArsR family regulator